MPDIAGRKTRRKRRRAPAIPKPTERAYILLKTGTWDSQNNPPFERSACFYVKISGNFEPFQ